MSGLGLCLRILDRHGAYNPRGRIQYADERAFDKCTDRSSVRTGVGEPSIFLDQFGGLHLSRRIIPSWPRPVPSDQPIFSLRPDAATTNAPPEVSPPGSEIFPDTFHELNPMGQPDDLAAHLLVVYNSNDPDSQELAEYYAARRDIPAERVLAIACPITEEITRTQYDDTIRLPIVSYLTQKDWMARKPSGCASATASRPARRHAQRHLGHRAHARRAAEDRARSDRRRWHGASAGIADRTPPPSTASWRCCPSSACPKAALCPTSSSTTR